MKRSLELLGVTSSGLEEPVFTHSYRKNDDELLKEALKVVDLNEQENFLRKFFENKPHGFVKSKSHLANLIKLKDPVYACDLIMSACQAAPINSECYYLFATIATENQAWSVANAALEVVKWLAFEQNGEMFRKSNELQEYILKQIQNGKVDNSKNPIWQNKAPEKYWILERLYFQSKLKKLKEYAFKLLKIFPHDKKNYTVVFKALVLIEDSNVLDEFINLINENLATDEVNKNLYLGMVYYHLNDFYLSGISLETLLKLDKRNAKAYLYLALNCLMQNKIKEFLVLFNKILPEADAEFTAVYFIYSALSSIQLEKVEFPNQKSVSREIKKIIEKMINVEQLITVNNLIAQFKALDYYLILPFLPLYLSELFIRKNDLNVAKQILNDCKDPEVHRLLAWIYRLTGENSRGEEELIKYRMNWIPNKSAGVHCKLVDLKLNDEIPSDKNGIFNLLKKAYEQTSEMIKQLDLEYGLNSMTCVETGCQDCCRKTFPYMSYTEYLLMCEWLKTQPGEFKKKVTESSQAIVSLYKSKYGKEPPFMSGESFDLNKEYPLDFVFECPYLGNNKCNVYEARPFTCRAYSYGSQDGVKYKGCNYFFEQLKGATKLNDVRKVLNMGSFYDFAKKTDEKLFGKRVIAPIPVWFAQSYEETLEKIKKI